MLIGGVLAKRSAFTRSASTTSARFVPSASARFASTARCLASSSCFLASSIGLDAIYFFCAAGHAFEHTISMIA
jgi:hypothetical protein